MFGFGKKPHKKRKAVKGRTLWKEVIGYTHKKDADGMAKHLRNQGYMVHISHNSKGYIVYKSKKV